MGAFIDLTGQRFGQLTVIGLAQGQDSNGGYRWRCLCDCGTETTTSRQSLRSGKTRSCGCLHRKLLGARNQSIKMRTCREDHCQPRRLYAVWKSMNQRCSNPRNKDYKIYGGRGVKVCDEWKRDFAAFKAWALSAGYDPSAAFGQCTIDRIDGDGNYEPSNCRWATTKTQNNNRHKKGWLTDADHIRQDSRRGAGLPVRP